jgi:LysR family hydrogen peroxide-inducible transcriptional activator
MAPYLLPTVVAEVRRRQPRAELRLREERTVDLLARLRDGDVDLALLAGPVDGDDLEVTELADEAFVLALPEGHDFAGRAAVPASALAGLPVILLEEGHCLRDQALSLCAVVGASPLGDIQGTSLATLCQLVAAGQGVTLLPASAVAVEARPGLGLTTRPLRAPAPRRSVVLAWRRSSPRARHFAELARALRAPVRQACRA